MSLPNELLPVGLLGTGAVDTGYLIERSLRFNSADSAYLSRTPASAGNRKTWTWAGWVKGTLDQRIFSAGVDAADDFAFGFYGNGYLDCFNRTSGVLNARLISTSFYRDPSAWYHFVCVWNSSSATASDRFQIWVNGNRLTDFSTATYPTQNLDCIWNNTTTHYIGSQTSILFFSGYLADVHFIDGQALDPTSFGEFDTNNVWQPKAYSGSYGTNGFKLDFSNNSAATAAALGADSSGNGNNWTPNNLSVTAGAGNDSLVDTPTSYGTDTGAGAQVRGNYCTLNPFTNYGGTLSNGNLTAVGSTGSGTHILSTFFITTGKWYFEGTFSSVTGLDWGAIGISARAVAAPGNDSDSYIYRNDGSKRNNQTDSSYGLPWSSGDTLGVAFDADTGTLTFYLNGSSQGVAFSSIPSGSYSPAFGENGGAASSTIDVNFGQRPFAYTAPSGFKALCTTNLPEPTIADGSTAMDVVLYTGTGSSLTPTSTLGFSPDLVWIKSRSATTDHALYDAARGVQSRLESNNQDAQVTSDDGLTAFNSNGFTLGTLAQVNTNTATYAAWCWNESASSGFDIVTYTGNGTAGTTVAHSLGVKPSLMIVKQSSAGGTNWTVYHTSLGATKFLALQSTAAAGSNTNKWNDTEPTSTVFTIGSGNDTNENTQTFIGYLWAPVEGYSAFGSYTGNGSTDGPYIHLGFRPAFVIIKCSSASSTLWMGKDYKRAADYNPASGNLYLGGSNVEDTINTVDMDFLANGIKLRGTYGGINTSGQTYIYAAWAQHPFALARAR